MDASASLKVDDDVKDAYAYYLKIENKDFPTPCKQRSTVIKYTKLPEFENYSQGMFFNGTADYVGKTCSVKCCF